MSGLTRGGAMLELGILGSKSCQAVVHPLLTGLILTLLPAPISPPILCVGPGMDPSCRQRVRNLNPCLGDSVSPPSVELMLELA